MELDHGKFGKTIGSAGTTTVVEDAFFILNEVAAVYTRFKSRTIETIDFSVPDYL